MTVQPPAPVVLAVDLVVLTLRDDELCTLLVRRAYPPFAGRLALPGGFVGPDEQLREAATRELAEETGVRQQPGHLEQLATYADPGRDPRGRVVSVAFLALAPDLPDPVAGTDAAASHWAPVRPLLAGGPLAGDQPDALAFDHLEILRDGVERARAKIEYSPVATAFCPPEFTVAQLRRVYELVWDTRLDPRNFHRKVTSSAGFLVPTGQTSRVDGGRPAELFRPGAAPLLHPAMLRPAPHRQRG
ncbi:NUDIX hydrolase [Pseudofrankia inefficax]|uniref:NUDIX hydrolase n=1 Tax=Pseudofrankia inefficax (strain DSM 45817 / CECT 9037 / DDB 130130 / EuI1c) TaxID=298654 RepID=E3IUQ4_PSEI1|nr:NUDIX domain-containing protein [Pseudofrankia inefficax]ADP84870.1 NUDIX hydrolase [Pseudofrankia inefficax]